MVKGISLRNCTRDLLMQRELTLKCFLRNIDARVQCDVKGLLISSTIDSQAYLIPARYNQ